ncbi:MAG TPA: hypothetical protein VEZ11_05675 [Thermoanaerobaculia bacterium]|nr:hypothetical protein [Thermoanaerobaculia bacterium]
MHRFPLTMAIALTATWLMAAPPSTCGLADDYGRALCAYQKRNFPEAERRFRAILGHGEHDVTMIHSLYFLARTEMKVGRYEEASELLVRIYGLDPAFFQDWNCDFLVSECRRALGRE